VEDYPVGSSSQSDFAMMKREGGFGVNRAAQVSERDPEHDCSSGHERGAG